LVQISITTTAGGTPSEHVIPPAYHAVFNASKDIYQYALETWVEADPGSDVVIFAGRWNDSGAFGGHISISGYLIDAPSP
jgi:hypothetical protein